MSTADLTDSHGFFTFKSHADFADDADFLPFYFFTFLLFYLFTFLPLNSSFTFKSPCPQAVPSRKIWRGLWCPANLRAKRFWAPEGGYIPCPLRGKGLGEAVEPSLAKEGRAGSKNTLFSNQKSEASWKRNLAKSMDSGKLYRLVPNPELVINNIWHKPDII